MLSAKVVHTLTVDLLTACVEFVVHSVAMGRFFPQYASVCVSVTRPMLRTHSFISPPLYKLTLSLTIYAIYRRIFSPSVLHSPPLPFVLFLHLHKTVFRSLKAVASVQFTTLLPLHLATYNSKALLLQSGWSINMYGHRLLY